MAAPKKRNARSKPVARKAKAAPMTRPRKNRSIDNADRQTADIQETAVSARTSNGAQLRQALSKLTILGDHMFMRMQAFNLSITDPFMAELEADVLEKLLIEERTPIDEAAFLSALSQMWLFAVYELLRTWRQRAKDIVSWSEKGGLELKLKALEPEVGYPHHARMMRADQIRAVIGDPSIVSRLRDELRATHMLFARLEALRVSIAKHEVSGRPKAVALRPGYGRINEVTGSLDYELENGKYSMGYISRRSIADEIRALAERGPVPDDKTLAEFDKYIRGSEFEPPE